MQADKKNFWVQDHRQVYLIGNPIVWWSSSLGVALYLLARGLMVVRAQRGFRDLQNRELPWLHPLALADV